MGHDPEVLILDEPTSGLDTLVRREFLESMVDLAAEGKTVFLSSHQIPEVERVADNVAILKAGKIVALEPLDKLKDETIELTVSLCDGAAEPPVFSGDVLHQRRRGGQWRLLVRRPDVAAVETLRDHPTVDVVHQRTPSLEEIFVAYLQRDESRFADAPKELAS